MREEFVENTDHEPRRFVFGDAMAKVRVSRLTSNKNEWCLDERIEDHEVLGDVANMDDDNVMVKLNGLITIKDDKTWKLEDDDWISVWVYPREKEVNK